MSRADAVLRHYARFWSSVPAALDWPAGPRHELPAEFRVLRFTRSTELCVYATCGLSDAPGALELHVVARADAPAPPLVELLFVVSHYHVTGAMLGVGHTVNFGRPWLPGSRCSYGLVSLPYLDGPELEWMPEPEVRCLWLLAITEAELELKKRDGLDALEQRFDESGFDYADPLRASVAR